MSRQKSKSESTAKSNLIWAHVHPNISYHLWSTELISQKKWPTEWNIEKVQGGEASFAQIADAQRSISLFSKQKLIVVVDGEKVLKKEKLGASDFDRLGSGPNPIIFQSASPPPKTWGHEVWSPSAQPDTSIDDKAIFRWIDAIEAGDLRKAIIELDLSFKTGSHPLVFVQLATRHFRIGRLIQHASEKRLREDEMAQCLKVPSFVIQKWKRKKSRRSKEWAWIFDRLLAADLQMKSGNADIWALRTLTFDLIRCKKNQRQGFSSQNFATMKPASLFEPKLWRVVPFFS